MSRTVVDLQDNLVKQATKLTGLKKKVELVNFALARLIQQKQAEKILKLKGSIRWEGNLKAMRRNRFDFSR
jgi:Arc/MetJ family transcription regulator